MVPRTYPKSFRVIAKKIVGGDRLRRTLLKFRIMIYLAALILIQFSIILEYVRVAYNYILFLNGGWTTKSPADRNKSLSLPKSIYSHEVVSSCLGKDLSAWRRSPISGTDYSGRDHVATDLLLNGGWTSKSPADGNKFLLLPKFICSQEIASSCLGKDLSARQRSPISGTYYSGRDLITVEDCFWIARLVMKHSFSVSELQTVCSVHVANDPSQVVSVHYVRDSGVVSVEVLDSQLPKHCTFCQQCHTPPHRVGRGVVESG